MNKSAGIVIALLAITLLCGIGLFNSVKSARIEVDAQYGQVENQIQRRADLIPNLVSTVKGYMQYEEKVLTEVTAARTKVTNAASPEEMATADQELTGALGRLLAVAENIREYNLTVSTFPGNILAGMMGYSPLTPFAADEAAHNVPQVAF